MTVSLNHSMIKIKPIKILSSCLFCIFLFTIEAHADSLTITRSAASYNSISYGEVSPAEYQYDTDNGGIRIGNGTASSEVVYEILLPYYSHDSSHQISSITVTVKGVCNFSPKIIIGGYEHDLTGLNGSKTLTTYYDESARALIESVDDSFASKLRIEIEVGILAAYLDLKEIDIEYEYSGVSVDILKRFHVAYSAYRTLREYESGMVGSLWDTEGWHAELFSSAVQESLAFADNLSNLSGSLYNSLKTTNSCVKNFQTLASQLGSAFDYLFFRVNYDVGGGTPKSRVTNTLIDGRNSFYNYSQHLFNYAFDGNISPDISQINYIIDNAKSDTTDLRAILRNVASVSHRIYKDNGDSGGGKTAQIMLYSLAPLLNITYDINNFSSEPSYLTGLINELSHIQGGGVTYTITASSGPNGTLSPSGTIPLTQGSDKTFNAAPITGYEVYQWKKNGVTDQTGENSYTLPNIQADTIVSVTFKLASPPDPSEPNNSYQQASYLGSIIGEYDAYDLNISPGDIDFYKFGLVATGTQNDFVKILIQNDAFSGKGDYDLDLAIGRINSSGNFVPADGSWYNSMSLTDTRTETILLTDYEPGEYYAIIFGASGYEVGEDDPDFIGTEESGYILNMFGPKPKVDTPSISPDGGEFIGAAQVTLSCSTPGSIVRYTTNGTTPTVNSTQYAGPFEVSSSGTVKAVGFKNDYNDSEPASASFIITPAKIPEISVTPTAQVVDSNAGTTPITINNAGTGTLSVSVL